MSQRNPMNARYTEPDKVKGKTRKSAASAKPAMKVASTVVLESERKKSKAELRQEKQAAKERARQKNAEEVRYYNPPTEEYKKKKRLWWILLAAACVFILASTFLSRVHFSVMVVSMVLGYACIIAAIVLDLKVLRRMRNEYSAKMAHRSKADRKIEKQQAAARRAMEKARKENPEPEPVKKPRKNVFGKVKKSAQQTLTEAEELKKELDAR